LWALVKRKAVDFALFVQDNEQPFHVANLDSIFEKHLKWRTNLPRVKPFYAVKCNNDAAVLRMMTALDTGFDCASKVPGGISKSIQLCLGFIVEK